MPQIEVTFDIDANGILRVRQGQGHRQRAEDRDQGQLGSVRRRNRQDGRDAEANAEEDQVRELATRATRATVWSTPPARSITEAGDKATADEKAAIEKAIGDLEAAVKGDDKAAIEAKINACPKSRPLAQKMYAEQAQAAAARAPTAGRRRRGRCRVRRGQGQQVSPPLPELGLPAGHRCGRRFSARGLLPRGVWSP